MPLADYVFLLTLVAACCSRATCVGPHRKLRGSVKAIEQQQGIDQPMDQLLRALSETQSVPRSSVDTLATVADSIGGRLDSDARMAQTPGKQFIIACTPAKHHRQKATVHPGCLIRRV